MIPVFYHADMEVAKGVLDASYKGGVRVFEFTNRGENAFQVFTQLLKHAEQYPDLMLGIGTVMNAAVTQKYIDAGAHFIVSPILKPEMATVCQQADKLMDTGLRYAYRNRYSKGFGSKSNQGISRIGSRPWLCFINHASSARITTDAYGWCGADRSESLCLV